MAILLSPTAQNPIVTAIRSASQSTGADFDYLLKTAVRESGLRPDAKAPTSSATGLFQFIEGTWLRTLKDAGSQFGLGYYADQIDEVAPNRFRVANPALRSEILNLRQDPETAALMAGALTRANSSELGTAIGREPSSGELYIAHFLGVSGAEKLIGLAENRPGANAAKAFPEAARANRSIFYSRGGGARSASEVYRVLVRAHEGTDTRLAAGQGGGAKAPDEPVQAMAGTGGSGEPRSLFSALFSVLSGKGQASAPGPAMGQGGLGTPFPLQGAAALRVASTTTARFEAPLVPIADLAAGWRASGTMGAIASTGDRSGFFALALPGDSTAKAATAAYGRQHFLFAGPGGDRNSGSA